MLTSLSIGVLSYYTFAVFVQRTMTVDVLQRTFNVTQVYSQLSFTCPNESVVQFKQELKDNTDRSLLEDAESIDCRSV